MSTRIELTINPGEDARAAILRPLRAYNVARAGDPKPEAIALLVRDDASLRQLLESDFVVVNERLDIVEAGSLPEFERYPG